MKVYPTIVDNASNLLALTENIPDGLIIKEQGINKFKIGNGTARWSQLPYINQGPHPTVENDFCPKSYVDRTAQDAIPPGTVDLIFGTTAPDGYFLCSGIQFNQNRFPRLYDRLGTDVTPDYRTMSPLPGCVYVIKHDWVAAE